ncbi:MAG TPA: saccharopine dehydrogenase NADP-binding domain-containing protein [Planctomycetota bacterium]|nr:saccharopine dehydrogenase NADP-binding domain-containing protein [Planctomycetota bacterium]
MTFGGNVLVLGLGAVSRCAMPLLLKHLGLPPDRFTVIDPSDEEPVAQAAIQLMSAGVRFEKGGLVRDGIGALERLLRPGDLCVDLSVNVGTADLVRWCHERGVLFANTSVETWPGEIDLPGRPPTERAIYAVHMALRRMIAEWSDRRGPTAVIDHGANPGLVSHFTKVGLGDIAARWLAEHPPGEQRDLIQDALGRRAWAHLAMHLGVRVIHISERDTQAVDTPRRPRELANTWSAESLYTECCHAPVEMGWGTHEKQLPPNAFTYRRGPRNQICLDAAGISTRVRTWVPSGETIGFVVPHSEAFTISEHLTVREGNRPLYRPTVHFAYRPCDSALVGLFELYERNQRVQFRSRIITDEIVTGCDELGVLLMGHAYRSWWTGSVLDIESARQLVPHQNATTLQVACSLVAAAAWALRNPRAGVCVPDELPHEEILNDAKPYLGRFISRQTDWSPLDHWSHNRGEPGAAIPSEEDAWQFSTFLASAQ